MVLYIYKQNEDGGRNVIFDIEFYLKDDNFRDGRLWYSELHVVTMVKNLLIWYRDNQHNFTEETEQEFFNDIHEIDNLRGWLWEKEKNWAVADAIRAELLAQGYVIKNTKEGYEIEKK
jgi:cysteinyl-tRNA synthetase